MAGGRETKDCGGLPAHPDGAGEVMRSEGTYQSLNGGEANRSTLASWAPNDGAPNRRGRTRRRFGCGNSKQAGTGQDRNRTLEELVVTQGKFVALHVDVSVA